MSTGQCQSWIVRSTIALRGLLKAFRSSGLHTLRAMSTLMPVLIGVPVGLAAMIGLGGVVPHSNALKALAGLLAAGLLAQWLLHWWVHRPEPWKLRLVETWESKVRWLLFQPTLGLWPVAFAVLTSLLGIAEWFPTSGPDRPILLASVIVVAFYGYIRTQAEKKADLVAFAIRAKDEFAEATKQILNERDREAEIDRLIKDIVDGFSGLKSDCKAFGVDFRSAVNLPRLMNECKEMGITGKSYAKLLRELGVD
jgi:hypothetical protein